MSRCPHPRFRNLPALVLAALLACPLSLIHAEEAAWKVGLAKAKITPEEPLWMAGYAARTRPAEGTLHDLWIKVLALEAPGGGRAVVVTGDLLGFPHDMAEHVCKELRQRCGLTRPQVMLTCSHSHCTPVLQGALFDCYPLEERHREAIGRYSRELEKVVIQTTVRALESLSPATLSAAEGEAGFAANRRNYGNGVVLARRAAGKPLRGPMDHRVPVLAVRSPEGRLRAVVFGYACHNTTLDSYQWCGDYAGFAQIDLEKSHPEAMAMFYIGCGADQNPLPRREVELCRQHGASLAAAVEEVLRRPMRSIRPALQTAFETLDLPFQPTPTREWLQAEAKRSDYHGRWAKRLLGSLEAGKPLTKSAPYPVQVWRLGTDQLWIALGGEVVVDYAIRFKADYGPTTWVAGYANEVMAYIPSARVWREGGYEAGAFDVYGLPAQGWAAGIEEKIARSAGRLVAALPAPPTP